jgi:glucuronoarabinoxylan endo-1,4-beta-xylanase
MKLNFFKTVGRSKAYLLLLLSGVLLAPMAGMATDSIYINTGAIDNSNIPQIDASNFVNSGTWNIGVTLPYQTSHTLNYTNTGSMVSSVGWEFDYGPLPLIGGRGWSSSFVNNSAAATIQAVDGTVTSPHGSQNLTTASYLWISATNIINKGMLLADPNGQIVLSGDMVNLSRSQLLVSSTLASSGFISGTNFALDAGLYPESWGQSNMPAQNLPIGISMPIMNISSLWDGNTATAPLYAVQNNCTSNYLFGPSLSFQPTLSGSQDIQVGGTNEFRQAVFIAVSSNANITPQIAWTISSNPTNYLQTAAVQLTTTLTNPFTLAPENSSIYVVDMLGSETNRGLYVDTNVPSFYTCSGKLFQPANYIVSRSDPVLPQTGLLAFADGAPGFGKPAANFFNNSTFVFGAASNSYAGYSVFVDDLATDPSGAAATNLPGVIQISANNLDLTRTWLGGQGGILIQASNLVSSAGAIVDSQNLSFYLGSTNGFLNLTNMAKQNVSRLKGTLNMWSAVWTNLQPVTIGTNQTTNTIACSIMLVDATGLSSVVPVTVQNLVMHSTNSTISDSLTVAQTLLLDGQGFKLLGQMSLSGALQDWTSALAPNLLYFTNNGFLQVPNNAHFGDDTAVPYAEFINNGTGTTLGGVVLSRSQTINSQDIQISNAVNYTFGSFSATAGSIEINGIPSYFPYSIYSGGDITFNASTMQIGQAAFLAGGALNFNVTNLLSDNGVASTFICTNGFNMGIKPQNGDLLGSTLIAVASGNNAVVDSTWAGQDRGPSLIGFTSNAVVGTLALVATNYLPQFTPLFVFSKASATNNAMYVSTLDLSRLTTSSANLANMIQINPGMTIYISQVILGFTPPGGQSPLAYVQSQFPGQIVAVHTVVSQSGTLDWNTVYQRIDGFGASSAWQRTWTPAQADMFFSTTNSGTGLSYNGTNFSFNGIGLSLLRNHIAYANTPLATDTPTTVETNMMLMAQARGALIWSSPWTPAAGFKSINDIYDTNTATAGGINGGSFWGGNATNLAYASQLANYVASMKNNYGINLYAISIQNEPDAKVTSYEACQWTNTQIHDFVTNLYNALVAKGVGSTKIIIPESQNWSDPKNLAGPTLSDLAAAADVGVIADHDYNTIPPSGIPAQKAASGKSAWETETANLSNGNNGSIAEGIYWAGRIYQFMTVAQANAWHFWWLIGASNSGYNNSNQGLADTNGVPTKRMYVLGQFSRFVRPGYERIGAPTNGNLLITAFKDTSSPNFAIVAINTNASIDVNQTFNLTNFSGVSNVTPWITSASSSLAMQSAVSVSNSSFTYTIPAQSVVTFVGQASVPVNITISGAAYQPGGHFVLTWNATSGMTYSVLKTNILGNPAASWQAIVTNYPSGGAAAGPLSYTDTTATASPAFYRVKSP